MASKNTLIIRVINEEELSYEDWACNYAHTRRDSFSSDEKYEAALEREWIRLQTQTNGVITRSEGWHQVEPEEIVEILDDYTDCAESHDTHTDSDTESLTEESQSQPSNETDDE